MYILPQNTPFFNTSKERKKRNDFVCIPQRKKFIKQEIFPFYKANKKGLN